ncbi:Possibl zinc metallo-peptidase [Planctomycetes bacterium Poly30]|uniref:Possibl zinc metallo-peptidase n=1 Tax=Saltatorellus ferox TaxID=2528018 RepID=A0A518EQN8_9BACT|nr:Possibl zinc metallo-peptidase [Planctomycetes bacterium Poly30]
MIQPEHDPDPDSSEEAIDPAIRAAGDALDNGDPESALVEAARAKDPGERALMEVRAYMAMGMLEAAEGAHGRAVEALGDDDVDVVEIEGEIALLNWELEHATECFEAIAEVEDDPYILERLALLADLAGDEDASHALMEKARELDPERPEPIRLSEEAFASVVDEALADMPPEFKKAVESARIVSEPVPFVELDDQSEEAMVPPDVLGLFVGPTIHELADAVSGELPPTIYLFQRNLERMARGPEELAIEIRVTLFHEIGHLLGLDEDEVAAMGLA